MDKSIQKLSLGFVIAGAALVLSAFWNSSKTSEITTPNTAKAILKVVAQNYRPIHTKSLQNAYTGNWFKNKPVETSDASQFQFTPPTNTRNTEDTSKALAEKKKNDKKKKLAKKKKLQAYKFAKKRYQNKLKSGSLFDNSIAQRDVSNIIYYPYNQKPQNTQQTQEADEKKWTVEELYANALKTKSIEEIVSLYKNGEISATIYYGVTDKLLSSQDDAIRKIGYSALSQTPSLASFSRHASFLESESSEDIKIYANELLEVYKQISYTPVLNQGLSIKEKEVQILAATYLSTVVDYISQNASTEETRVPSSLIPQNTLQKYKTLLTQSIQIMTLQISKGQMDTETLAIYQQSMNHIQNYLSSLPAEQNLASF